VSPRLFTFFDIQLSKAARSVSIDRITIKEVKP
jgi:hypothetical protein